MKKILLYIVCSVFSGIGLLNAQRLIPEQQGLEASVSLPPTSLKFNTKAYAIELGYTRYAQRGNYWQYGIVYTRDFYTYRQKDLPIETYTAEGGYSLRLIGNSSRNISFNIGLSGVIGYERINKGNHVLADGAVINNKDNFVYGGLTRLRLERYLMDDLIVFAQGQTQILWGTNRELFRPHIGLGFRFTL